MLDETLLREAEAFANSQTLAEVFKRLKQGLQQDWADSPPSAQGEREHLHRLHDGLRMIEAALKALAETGKIDAYNRSLAARQKVE